MATPLRNALTSSLRPIQRGSAQVCRANFASSSRHGLDFTRPRLDESKPKPTLTTATTTTTTVDAPPHLPQLESQPIPTLEIKPPYPVPTPPSAKPIPTIIPRTVIPTSTLPPSAKRPSRRDVPLARYAPIEALNDPIDERGNRDATLSNPIGKTRRITHILHIKCTRNNVHLSFVDAVGNLFGTITAGSDKVFKKSNRSSYEAAHQATLKIFEKVLEFSRDNQVQLCVAFKGLMGTGREAVAAAIMGPEGAEFSRLIVKVEDRTPIAIGGDRARGRRNV